jgi:hypothetical protein
MRYVIISCCLLLALSGCTASSADPSDASSVRSAVEAALSLIELGLEREDATLASQPVDEEFILGGNVSLRYSDTAWTGRGIGPFRGFFAGSFVSRGNVEQDFEVTELDVAGEIAQATIATRYSALRLDRSPPENLVAEATDRMVFQLRRGAWRLIGWDTLAAPEPPVVEPPAE